MTSPAGIPNFLVEGSSIAQSAVGVKTLRQAAPWLSRPGLQAHGKITTTNPWLRLPIPRGGTGLPWRVAGGVTVKLVAYRLRFGVTKWYVLPRPAHPSA